VTSWHDYPAAITGRTERELIAWLRANVRRGETWLDVGAHYGYTSIALAELVGPEGRVFAFEPMLTTAGALARTRAVNRFQQLSIIPIALDGEAGLHLADLPTTRGMVDSTLAATETSERFLAWSLDVLWPQIAANESRIDGVKIDVQGMEIHALKGMRRQLLQNRPKLVVEIHTGVDRTEFLQTLVSCGYDTESTPLEPAPGEVKAQLLDNRSYVFHPEQR
jgi:FkbM family methyltransferase